MLFPQIVSGIEDRREQERSLSPQGATLPPRWRGLLVPRIFSQELRAAEEGRPARLAALQVPAPAAGGGGGLQRAGPAEGLPVPAGARHGVQRRPPGHLRRGEVARTPRNPQGPLQRPRHLQNPQRTQTRHRDSGQRTVPRPLGPQPQKSHAVR